MSDSMTAQFITDALMIAIWRRGEPDAPTHYLDHGSQYTRGKFRRLMADNGVTCSMSRPGNVRDNAAMETFFSSLQTERIGRKTYRTHNQAKADVSDHLECFYNPTRSHSALGYLAPQRHRYVEVDLVNTAEESASVRNYVIGLDIAKYVFQVTERMLPGEPYSAAGLRAPSCLILRGSYVVSGRAGGVRRCASPGSRAKADGP